MKKRLCFLGILMGMAGFLAGQSAFAQNQSHVRPTIRFYQTANSLDKKDALREIGRSHANNPAAQKGRSHAAGEITTTPLELDEQQVLRDALSDRRAGIVEEAIRQVGVMGADSYNQTLIDLYSTADKKFGAYGERVKGAVVAAFAEMKGSASRVFLGKLLTATQSGPDLTVVLGAVGNLGDPQLLPDVIAIRQQLEALLEKRYNPNNDQRLYSELFMQILKAKQVEQVLAGEKGGAQ